MATGFQLSWSEHEGSPRCEFAQRDSQGWGRSRRALIVGGIILIIVMACSTGCSGRRISKLLEQGKVAEASGDKAKAAGLYSQVLLYQPENHELRKQVAALYYDLKDYSVASSHYLALLRVEPGSEEIRRRATVSLLAIHREGEATELVKAELKFNSRSGWGREAQGDLWLRQGEFQGALTNYTMSLGTTWLTADDQYRVTVKYARVLFSTGKRAEALEKLNSLVQSAPEKYDAHLLRANYYLATGDTNAARQAYVELQGQFPKSSEPLVGLAVLAVEAGRNDEAIELYEKSYQLDSSSADDLFWLAELHFRKQDSAALQSLLARIKPKDAGHEAAMNYIEGLLRLQKGEVKEAIDFFERVRPFVYQYGGLLDKLGRAYLSQGNAVLAERYLQQVQYDGGESQKIWTDLALAHLANRNFLRAASFAESVADASRHSILAEASFGLGDYPKALTEARQWMKAEPKSMVAGLIAAESSLRINGNDPGAVDFLRKLDTESPGTPLGVYAHAQVLLVEGKFAAAADWLIQHYATVKELPGANRALGEALLLIGRSDEARGYLEASLRLDPTSFQSDSLLGMIHLQRGEKQAARERFQRVLKDHPVERTAMMGNALLDYYAGKFGVASEGFDALIRSGVKQVAIHNLLAICEIRRHRGKEALAAAQSGWELAPEDRLAGYLTVSARLMNRQLPEVEAALKQCFKLDDQFAPYYHLAALLEADRKQLGKALELVEKGLKFDGSNPLLRPFQVELLRKLKRFDEAVTAVRKLEADFPDESSSWSAEGNIWLDQRNFESARVAYRKALALTPGDRITQQRLLDSWVLAGHVTDALGDLENALKGDPENHSLRFACARIRVSRGELAEAERLYLQIVKAEPRAVPALNNLAALLMADPARLKDAQLYAEQAFANDSGNPMVRDTLGAIYLQMGREEDALQLLKTAHETAKDNAEILLHLTQAQWNGGYKAAARRSWADLAGRFPGVAGSEQAAALRTQVTAPAGQSPK